MKDVLLFHDNARHYTHFSTREAIAKMGWTALPHSAHSPYLAPSYYRLFGPVKNPLRGLNFADDSELKVYVMCLEVEAGNFTALVYSVSLNFGRSVLKVTETLRKNNLITATDV
jgi:hypothetical protein